MSDIIRVVRVVEYIGERAAVEKVIKQSIKGTRIVSNKLTINAVTVGDFAEILKAQGETDNGK
mgnify:CR=1 FL=1